ncbi:hypothetical protein L7F22_066117 [Adiantum nelumboides]|nr:hypothetical protein [Adiantum nelumboides]
MLSSHSLPSGLTEILEESPSKKLLDAIIQKDCDASCLSDAINIVNPIVDLCLLVENARQYMLEEWQSFEGCLQKETIEYDGKEFVHLTDFSPDPIMKGKITRRFRKLKDSYLHNFPSSVCVVKHQKGGCNLVPKPIGFLFYLGLLIDTQPKEPQNIFEAEQQYSSETNPPFSFQTTHQPLGVNFEVKKLATSWVSSAFSFPLPLSQVRLLGF